MDIKSEVFVRELLSEGDGAGGEIDTCHLETMPGEDTAVPAPSTGEIQHLRTRRRPEQPEQAIDKTGGLVFVTVRIEPVVIGRVEPFPEPIRGDRFVFRRAIICRRYYCHADISFEYNLKRFGKY